MFNVRYGFRVHILLVEDDIWLAELYQEALEVAEGFSVFHATTAEHALEALDNQKNIKLIILDMFLMSHNGIEFLHEIASYPDINKIPIIVLSSVYQHDFGMSSERWRHYGVVQYLYKPNIKPADLVIAVKKQLALLEQTL